MALEQWHRARHRKRQRVKVQRKARPKKGTCKDSASHRARHREMQGQFIVLGTEQCISRHTARNRARLMAS